MLAIRRILHPTDFSASSRSPFEVASALARDYDAELLVCHVEPWPAATIIEGVALDLREGSFDAELTRLEALRADGPFHQQAPSQCRAGWGNWVACPPQ